MTKDEIKQEIKEARERHSAELKALEAKLNEPEKWEPKGGDWLVFLLDDYVVKDWHNDDHESLYRAKTEEEAEDLAVHLKRQAILKQLANDLNKGWKPDFDDVNQKKAFIYYGHGSEKYTYCNYEQMELQSVAFNPEVAEKACEILNNQPELMQ